MSHTGIYYDSNTGSTYYNTISFNISGKTIGFIDSSGRVGLGTGKEPLDAQVTISGNSENPPFKLEGLSGSDETYYVVIDNQGYLKKRNTIITEVDVVNNEITFTDNFGTQMFTINAITGGTFSGSTIFVEGSGSIQNITGITTFYNSDGSLTSDRIIKTNDKQITFSGGSDGIIKIIYTGSNSSDKVFATGSGNTLNFYVTANGDLYATSKNFLIPHQTKEGHNLRYGSIEGPEYGVYFRGKLIGSNKIHLPDYWSWLINEDSITVQLTPIGKYNKYYPNNITNNSIEIGFDSDINDINLFFSVFAERKDINKLIVVENNY